MSGYCGVCGETICVCKKYYDDSPSKRSVQLFGGYQMSDEAIDRISYIDKIVSELQDTCHKQSQRIAELEETVGKLSVHSDKNRLFDVPAYTRNHPVIPAESSVITIDRAQLIEMEEMIASRDEEIEELKAVIRRNEMT